MTFFRGNARKKAQWLRRLDNRRVVRAVLIETVLAVMLHSITTTIAGAMLTHGAAAIITREMLSNIPSGATIATMREMPVREIEERLREEMCQAVAGLAGETEDLVVQVELQL